MAQREQFLQRWAALGEILANGFEACNDDDSRENWDEAAAYAMKSRVLVRTLLFLGALTYRKAVRRCVSCGYDHRLRECPKFGKRNDAFLPPFPYDKA